MLDEIVDVFMQLLLSFSFSLLLGVEKLFLQSFDSALEVFVVFAFFLNLVRCIPVLFLLFVMLNEVDKLLKSQFLGLKLNKPLVDSGFEGSDVLNSISAVIAVHIVLAEGFLLLHILQSHAKLVLEIAALTKIAFNFFHNLVEFRLILEVQVVQVLNSLLGSC